MEEILKQDREHLAFLEEAIGLIHDHSEKILMAAQIEVLKRNIAKKEEWAAAQKRILSQSEPADVRLDQPYSHQPDDRPVVFPEAKIDVTPQVGDTVRVCFDEGFAPIEGEICNIEHAWFNIRCSDGGCIGGNVKDERKQIKILKRNSNAERTA